MKNPSTHTVLRDIRILISFAFVILPLSLLHGGGYIDEDNRLVIGGTVVEPPDGYVDENGNLVFMNRVFPAPAVTVMPDGSLLVDGVIYPVPEQPGEGFASFDDWASAAFPDPADRDNPEVSGPTADPLGLGVPNLVRYALAITDAADIPGRMPRIVFGEDGLGLRFPFIGLRDDLRIQVVAGGDLTSWDEVLWDSMADGGSAEPDTWLQVTDPTTLDPPAAARFLRLRVSPVSGE